MKNIRSLHESSRRDDSGAGTGSSEETVGDDIRMNILMQGVLTLDLRRARIGHGCPAQEGS